LRTRTHADANTLRNELRLIITQRWRGRRTTAAVGETLYWAQRDTRRNIAMYADRSPRPRLHVEFRYRGARSCQQRGINHAQDLVALDPYKVLLQDFCLSALNPKRVNKLVEQEARRLADHYRAGRTRLLPCFCLPDLVRRRLQRMVLTLISDDEELPDWADLVELPVQEVLDAAYFLHDRYATVRLPGACLLTGVAYIND
jgi:hypothetical protein